MTTTGHKTATRFNTRKDAWAAAAILAERPNVVRAHVRKSDAREWTLDCVVKHTDNHADTSADLAAVETFGPTSYRFVTLR